MPADIMHDGDAAPRYVAAGNASTSAMGQGLRAPPGEISVFGYRFHPMLRDQVLDHIFNAVADRRRSIIAAANLHGLYMYERDSTYRRLLDQRDSIVIVDGMPVIWLLRALGHPVMRAHRTTWVDWFPLALERAARDGYRVFILGYSDQILSVGFEKARALWPTLAISGRNGYFDAEDPVVCREVLDAVNDARPDIVIVGMGMPRQETFVERHAAQIEAPVIGLGGAAFAYFAGEQVTPPRWMGRAGLEWAYRLARNPSRLAGRYLLEPFLLAGCCIWRLARQKIAGRGPLVSGAK